MTEQLAVNEVFDTMQGEAMHTGTPATFVRLQGCAVGCPWCDTKHTWDTDPAHAVSTEAMLAKQADAPTYALLDVDDLVDLVAARTPKAVVITGGEPCASDLVRLTTGLFAKKRLVQVETSGTQPVRVARSAWVTLSPKVGMPGGFKVLPEAVRRADEIKWPVGKPADVDALRGFLREHKSAAGYDQPVWLQPLSRSPKATELCIAAATEHGWRVSVQVHALLGVR